MRTYAVELEDGEWGPEFNSSQEAFRWASANLPADEDGRLSVRVLMIRDGRVLNTIGVMGKVHRA